MGFLDIANQILAIRQAEERKNKPAPPPMPTVIAERRDPRTGLIMTETSNVLEGPAGPHMVVTREPRRPDVTIGTAYGEAAPVAPPMVSTMPPGDAIAQAAGFLKKKK